MSVLICPVCTGSMREQERDGVTIDICTQCRGVWLDRGELEKIAAAMARKQSPADLPKPAPVADDDGKGRIVGRQRYDDDDDDDDDRPGFSRAQGRRGGGFLDFFD